jgi:coatomer subunit beta
VKSSLKVSSTDNGAIYGYLTFDSASGNLPHVININEIQIDFINALMPAECAELEFKLKWAEYEWENKVHVSTPLTDLKAYVEYFAKEMNIKLMTQITEADQQAGFLVANFYTRSKFQEDCLLNVSIEKIVEVSGDQQNVRITGMIRLRAKTEGMALCVGERCKQLK